MGDELFMLIYLVNSQLNFILVIGIIRLWEEQIGVDRNNVVAISTDLSDEKLIALLHIDKYLLRINYKLPVRNVVADLSLLPIFGLRSVKNTAIFIDFGADWLVE